MPPYDPSWSLKDQRMYGAVKESTGSGSRAAIVVRKYRARRVAGRTAPPRRRRKGG